MSGTGLFKVIILVFFLAILYPLLLPLSWATITVAILWPLKLRTQLWLRSPLLSSWVLSLTLIGCLLLTIILPLIGLLEETRGTAENFARNARKTEASILKSVEQKPYLRRIVRISFDSVHQKITKFYKVDESKKQGDEDEAFGYISYTFGIITRFLISSLVFAIACFYLFLRGEILIQKIERVLKTQGWHDIFPLLVKIPLMLRQVGSGIILTALIQGFASTIGYFIAGISTPILLGYATAIAALIPFGPPIVYVPVAAALSFEGPSWWNAVFLMTWGVCVVSTIDNFCRPLLIGRSMRMPFLVILASVWGGVVTFGVIGLFLGPVIVGLCQQVWDPDFSRETIAGDDPVAVGAKHSQGAING